MTHVTPCNLVVRQALSLGPLRPRGKRQFRLARGFAMAAALCWSARNVSRNSRDTDSDGNSNDDQRVPQTSASEDGYRKTQELMAAKKVAAIKQNDETAEYVLKRLISQSKKMKDKHLIALAMCHAGRDMMIAMQHSAAVII